MHSIKKVKQELEEKRRRAEYENTYVPSGEVPEFGEIEINTSVLRSMYDPRDLTYIDHTKLIDPDTNLYFYNAGFYENDKTTYRMFYRCGKNPKAYEDRLATCLLDRNFNVLSETNKYIDVHSSWHETTENKYKLKSMIPFLFKNGLHVEDPRVIRNDSNWFVLYTDGIRMGVAKLDEECNTLYTHYLQVPDHLVKTIDSDGREKNWIPIKFVDGYLHVLYSESPRTIFKYSDKLTHLQLVKTSNLPWYNINWDHGFIRGGCPPVSYDGDKYVWFFHSVKKAPTYVNQESRIYMIGGYITKNEYPYEPLQITVLPVLIGWPCHAVSKLMLQDNVVFPCGAIHKKDDTYIICMGINDYRIAYLEVSISKLLWKPCEKVISLGILACKF